MALANLLQYADNIEIWTQGFVKHDTANKHNLMRNFKSLFIIKY